MPGVIPSAVITAAQAAQRKWGIPASVTIAQWAVESAWGRHMPPGSNNPFGIKATDGHPSVTCLTHEVVNGERIEVRAAFRKFGSMEEAFDDHGRLLAQAAPYAKARKVLPDPEMFANALTGVYATDPAYGRTLISVMDSNDLYRFDKGPLPVIGPTVAATAVLAPATVLAVHAHSPLLPALLGVSLALGIAWVIITHLKGKTMPTQEANDIVTAIDNLTAAVKAADAAANGTAVADLTAQLSQAQADLATEKQAHADDLAAIKAKVSELTPAG